MPSGKLSAGELGRKASSKPALPLFVYAPPTDHRNGLKDKGQQHLPGDEAWLIGEHRASGEKKYYLANLPATAALPHLGCHHQGARWIS